MFIQFTALGFEPLKHESPPITTRPGLPPTLRLLVVIFKNFQKEAEEGRGCCKGKCTWRKCGIITGVISVLIVLILAAGALRWYAKLTGEASSEDSEEWNQMLTEDQNGEAIMIK